MRRIRWGVAGLSVEAIGADRSKECPTRELKTPQQISDWITDRLQTFPGCPDATVIIQYEIQEPSPDGCNWSEDLLLNYGTCQREVVLQHLRPLHREARRRFYVG